MGLWRRYLDWRQRHVVALVLTDPGFSVRGKAGREVEWKAIRRIVAFKRDLLTTDLLCLLLELDDGPMEINEQMIGYAAIEGAMLETLGLGAEWKMAVLFPAFEANATTIYERPF